jgi:radical SAM-linked protein
MRLRITFSKTGSLRYIGHLDLHQVLERTARRAGLPLAYTQGFHPGPRIQIAAALPLGFLGRAEVVDMWLKDNDVGATLVIAQGGDNPSPCADLLQSAAPPGLTIFNVEEVDERAPALQTQVAAAEYEVTFLASVDEPALAGKIATLLEAASLPRERRGKAYDLRPLILSLSITTVPLPVGEEVGARVQMTLSAREGATGRPEEVLAGLGFPFENTRIERTRLIFQSDGR